MHIWYVMLWELKNNKKAVEKAKKISNVYGQDLITTCKVRKWFAQSAVTVEYTDCISAEG